MNGRQSQSTGLGVGVVARAVQLDFEKEEKKIQNFESTNKKFYKDVKYYVEKIEELNKSEVKMINNLSALASNSSSINSNGFNNTNGSSNSTPALNTSVNNDNQTANSNEFCDDDFVMKLKQWKEMLNEHNKSCEMLKQSCLTNVIEPMKNLNVIFPHVYSAIKRREQLCKELLKQQEKLDKAQEKERTGTNLVKINELTQAVRAAKQQFEKENTFLMEELPKFYNSRVDYIRPCVNSLIQSQSNFYEKYANFYESILKGNNDNEFLSNIPSRSQINETDNDVEIEKIDQEIQKCLNDIKGLSIVAGD